MTEEENKVWKELEKMGWSNKPEDMHLEYFQDIIRATKKALVIAGVSGMFSEKHLIQAYNDGMEAEQQRCDNFDIKNYR